MQKDKDAFNNSNIKTAKEETAMRNNMMNNCRMAMSRVPGVDRDTLKDVLAMTIRSHGSEETAVTSTLLNERESIRSNFRSWMSLHI